MIPQKFTEKYHFAYLFNIIIPIERIPVIKINASNAFTRKLLSAT